jgi:hypothetical protein
MQNQVHDRWHFAARSPGHISVIIVWLLLPILLFKNILFHSLLILTTYAKKDS